jgi:18S rRNA (guanine1575-N7)-methyltransferase
LAKGLGSDPEVLMVLLGLFPLLPIAYPLLILFSSISVLQWLLNAETSHPTSSPPHRLTRFFTTLHSALRNPSRAVFQFYPSSDDQIQLITSSAQKAGFGGGLVVDYPNSKKAKKVFLCLFVGGGGGQHQVPKGLEGEEEDEKVQFEKRRERERGRDKTGKRKNVKDKDWILKKKEVSRESMLSR